MQLSEQTVDFMSRVLRVARILQIENVILDHECIRGHVRDQGLMIIHRENIPPFEFQSLGISRIDILNNRLALFGTGATIEMVEIQRNSTQKIVSKLLLSKGKTEVEFKCGDPTLMDKMPKNLKDPVYYTFKISSETVALLSKAQSAMRGENITFAGQKSGIICKLSDVEGDMMNHMATEDIVYSPESDAPKFIYCYNIKILMPLLKEALIGDNVEISITRRGIMKLTVLGITTYISAIV